MAQGRPSREDGTASLGALPAWSALAALPTHILLLDGKGRIVYCNPAWRRLRSRGPVGVGARVGDNYLARLRAAADSFSAQVAQALSQMLQDGQSFQEIEYPAQTQRDRRWFGTRAWLLDKCEPARLMVTHRPVTRLREDEAALQESRNRMDSILRVAPAGIGVVVNRVIMEANDRLCRMTGYERSELTGQSARMLYPTDEDYEYVGREKYAQISRQGTGTVETRWRRKDGRVIDVLLSSAPIHPGDLSQGVTFTALDITDQKATLAALRRGEQEKSIVLNTTQEMFVFYDRDMRVQWANKAAAQAAGRAPEDMAGRSYQEVWRDRGSECVKGPVRRALSSGEPQQGELELDDGTTWFLRGYPVHDAKGQVTGVIEFGLDVTAAKRAERLLRVQYELGRSLLGASSVADGAERILDAALSLGGFECGGLYLVTPGTGTLELIGHRGLTPEFVQSVSRLETDSPQAILVAKGEPLYGSYADIAPHPDPVRAREGLKAFAFVPVLASDRTVAVLNVASRTMHDIPPGDRRALEMIADQAGEIVARLQAQEALNESERKHRSLFETMAQGVVYQDAEGRVLDANPAAERILGLTLDQLTGRVSRDPRWRAIHEDGSEFPGQDHPSMVALRTDREVRGVIMGIFNPVENAYRWIQVHAIPQFRQGDPRPFQVYTTFEDFTLRKAAEDALRAKTEEMDQFFNVAVDMFAIADSREARFRRLNKEWEKALGWSVEEMTGRSFMEFVHPEDHDATLQAVRSLSAQNPVLHFVNRYRCKDGAWRWLEWRSIPQGDNIYAAARDITQRIKAEESLRESEERFRLLVESAPDGIFVQTGGRFAYVNGAAVKLFGAAQAAQLEGQSVLDRVGEDYRAQVQARIHALNNQRSHVPGVEEAILRLDGEPVAVEVQAAPIRYAGENGAIVFLREITERKQAEQRLRDSEQRLAGIFDHLPDATFVIDTQGVVIAWNKAIEELTGVPASEVVGQDNYAHALPFYGKRRPLLADLILNPDPAVEALYTNMQRQGKTLVAESAMPHMRPGGAHVWAKATALYDAHGRVIGAIESIRDTTERKRAEEERLRLESQMQQVQKLESLGVLAGGIAHDFNNLLMAVLGNAGLALLDTSPTHPARENLKAIETAARRAADLCRQMLAYAGKGRFVIQAVNLNEVIREMTHLLEVSISKKVVLRYRLADTLPSVEADASQMRQVIMNLITNASEAVGERSGVISITTGALECDEAYLSGMFITEGLKPGRYVSVEVADTGCGMDEATQARIFEPFFTTKFMGRGLGLAAVLGIVRGHHGAIKVYSEPGQGTTFKLLLPASDLLTRGDAAGAGDAGWKGRGKALLVDDEQTVRVVGKSMLQRLGFEVVCASDGAEAVAIFRERPDDFACVILDLTMPHMDGEEAFRELRRLRPDVRVLLSSGYNEQEVTQRFAGKGLAGFIQKPYQVDTLAQALRKMLDSGAKPPAGGQTP